MDLHGQRVVVLGGTSGIGLATAKAAARPGVAYSHVSDLPPNQVCLAWDATRRSRLIQDFAAIAADHLPVASQCQQEGTRPAGR